MKYLKSYNENLQSESQELAEILYYAFEDHEYYTLDPLNRGYMDTVYYKGVVEVRDKSSGQFEAYIILGLPEDTSLSCIDELCKLNEEFKKLSRKHGFDSKSHVDFISSYIDTTDNQIKTTLVIYYNN